MVITLVFWVFLGFVSATDVMASEADDANVQPVIVEKVEGADISQQLQTSGDVMPLQGADIHPKITGEIFKINVSESSQVVAGEVLAEIDHRILDAQLEQAKAAVTVAKASVEVQAVLVKSADSALVSAKAHAESIKAQVVNLAATRKRIEELGG